MAASPPRQRTGQLSLRCQDNRNRQNRWPNSGTAGDLGTRKFAIIMKGQRVRWWRSQTSYLRGETRNRCRTQIVGELSGTRPNNSGAKSLATTRRAQARPGGRPADRLECCGLHNDPVRMGDG